jgi:SAM-dependent methyltransferase
MPIDRYYIERFLADHSEDVRGNVLEVGDNVYSERFGGSRILRQDVLHIDESNPAATIVGDLTTRGLLPARTFDCIILTQTLQYIFDLRSALAEIRRSLRPGGVLLLTVPGLSPVSLDDWRDCYYWRFTANAIERLLSAEFDSAGVIVSAFGNVYAATRFLHGAAVEELRSDKLKPTMAEYAIVIAARALA